MTGERYWLTFSREPQHVRLQRLQSGRAPVLDSHSSWRLGNVVGVVESATLEEATIRLSQREELKGLRQDVQDGIIRNVSMGARIHRLDRLADEGEMRSFLATDWEPEELSLVPIGADAGAATLGGVDGSGWKPPLFPCILSTPAREAVQDDTRMSQPSAAPVTAAAVPPVAQQPAPMVAAAATPTAPAAPAPDPATLAAAQAEGARLERLRVSAITTRCKAAGMPDEFRQTLLDDPKMTPELASDAIFARLAQQNPPVAPQASQHVTVGLEQIEKVRLAVADALMLRMGAIQADPPARPEPGKRYIPKPAPGAEQFKHFSLLRMGEELLRARGERDINVAPAVLAQRLMMSTSDFPKLLVNAADKRLQDAYREVPRNWMPLSRQSNAADFKTRFIPRLSEAPSLTKLTEGAEITVDFFGEEGESYRIFTYAKAVVMTRPMIVNDDLGAFDRMAAMWGASAARLQNEIVWGLWKSNPVMGDGVALFHANHNNLLTGAQAPDVTGLGLGRKAMRKQVGIKGSKIEIIPRFLIGPAALETAFDQVLTQITPNEAAKVNPFPNTLTPIVSAYLDAPSPGSDVAWYLACTPVSGGAEVLEHAFLDGAGDSPMIDTEPQFFADGFGTRCIMDFGAAFMDWRGVFKHAGA